MQETNPKVIKKNCPKCNGKLTLRKATSSMHFGNCQNCKRAYALIKRGAFVEPGKMAA